MAKRDIIGWGYVKNENEIKKPYLVLDEELDTLNRGSGSLRDGGGNTTHCRHAQLAMLSLRDIPLDLIHQAPESLWRCRTTARQLYKNKNSRRGRHTQEVDQEGL